MEGRVRRNDDEQPQRAAPLRQGREAEALGFTHPYKTLMLAALDEAARQLGTCCTKVSWVLLGHSLAFAENVIAQGRRNVEFAP